MSKALTTGVVDEFGKEVGRINSLLTTRAHRIASGQAVTEPSVSVQFHSHSVELVCEGVSAARLEPSC